MSDIKAWLEEQPNVVSADIQVVYNQKDDYTEWLIDLKLIGDEPEYHMRPRRTGGDFRNDQGALRMILGTVKTVYGSKFGWR